MTLNATPTPGSTGGRSRATYAFVERDRRFAR